MFPTGLGIGTAQPATEENAGHTGKISFVFDFDAGDFVLEDGGVKPCTGEEAIAVWVQKICRTEKNRWRVYDGTTYGVVTEDLTVGARYTPDFAESELRRELEEALLQHEQISGLASFACTYTGSDKLKVQAEILTAENGVLTQEVTYGG